MITDGGPDVNYRVHACYKVATRLGIGGYLHGVSIALVRSEEAVPRVPGDLEESRSEHRVHKTHHLHQPTHLHHQAPLDLCADHGLASGGTLPCLWRHMATGLDTYEVAL
ncbi:hypothetical protein BBOV_I005855 [Babesia bovis T2Bo]|uniref:hypothetical protein n=1 Tax=Babesia bovis T2Bo TaxID=484906 RepID=UPI001C344F4E|nr:hypothetical protein BBOV_I005855 [Babesia bovis T2Bo]KAG6440229.1 hypothetical protein BBOV_I005855 [Babesia bovis T2Bo]